MSPFDLASLEEEIQIRTYRDRALKRKQWKGNTSYVRRARSFNAAQLKSLQEEAFFLRKIFE